MNDKLKASIYGFIIGDALGVPVEFKSREYLEQNPVIDMMENISRKTTKGYWSDDTAMTLCTMQSLVDNNDKNISMETEEDMLKKYCDWVEKGYKAVNNKCFGIGQNTLKVLTNYRKSKSLTDYIMHNNPEDEKKGGNGALMRILPLVLYLYNNDLPKYSKYDANVQRSRKYDVIEFNNDLTHNNGDSRNCCVFYTMFIFNLLDTGDIQKSYKKAMNECITWFNGFPSKKLERILFNKLIDLDKSEIKSSGYVVDTLEASLWCLFNTHSYEEAVLTAVNLGGDSDTIGAITGSLAGLYYGIEQIPKKWLNELCEKEMLNNDINQFLNKTLKSKIINDKLIDASFYLRSKLWMKYVKICTEYSTVKDINICNKLLEEFKIELCEFHDYTIALSYEESEKKFRNDILHAIEDFIEIIEKKISGELDESNQSENDLLKKFDVMRKASNLFIRMKKNQNKLL